MIKYCNTCRLSDKTKKICLLSGISINLDTDFCSKHAETLKTCCICGGYVVEPGYIDWDGEGEVHEYCERCHQLFNTCQFCPSFQKCEFMTNPDPMPQVVTKTVRQGNMMMQTQVKNEERVQKFCPSCCCWDENHGCMKEFNVGCVNKQDFWSSRNPS